MVNLAHGAFYLLGGYVDVHVMSNTGSLALGILAGGGIALAGGLLMERFLLQRVRGLDLGEMMHPYFRVLIMVFAVLLGIALWVVMTYTRLGAAIRASDWLTTKVKEQARRSTKEENIFLLHSHPRAHLVSVNGVDKFAKIPHSTTVDSHSKPR